MKRISKVVQEFCAHFLAECSELDYEASFHPHQCDDCNGSITIRVIVWSDVMEKYISAVKEKNLLDIERYAGSVPDYAKIEFGTMRDKIMGIIQPVQSKEKH